MAGCVFGYFADCTVVMPLFLLIAILRNVGIGMLRFGRRAWASHSQAALPWLRCPHFIMFSGYQLTKVCQKIRSHFINKQRHPFWPFSSLTWCCALLLHKLCIWFQVNKLSLNISKTNFMVFTNRSCDDTYIYCVHEWTKFIEGVCHKILGCAWTVSLTGIIILTL